MRSIVLASTALSLVIQRRQSAASQQIEVIRPDCPDTPQGRAQLVHEAYIRMMAAQAAMDWQDRAHFFGISARLMRQVLIDHARAKGRLKRVGEFLNQIDLDAAVSFDARKELDALAIDEALTMLESLDERQARIVEMKFFAGMQIEEIGEVLKLSPATVKREWSSAKLFLSQNLGTTG